jgi:NAD(P)-dependent dehydrogenase (short-subunit alcohol dehydrogenase family)
LNSTIDICKIDTENYTPCPDNDIDDFDRVMAINTKGMLLVSDAVVKVMLKQEPRTFTTLHGISRELSRGVIVNVTSAMSYGVTPGKIAYATSKHAALGVSRTKGYPSQLRLLELGEHSNVGRRVRQSTSKRGYREIY